MEDMMTHDTAHDLTEIGIVSADTKGAFSGKIDEEGSLRPQPGLTDD